MKRFLRDALKNTNRWALIFYNRDNPTKSLSVDGKLLRRVLSAQSTLVVLLALITSAWAFTRYKNFSILSSLNRAELELRAIKDELASNKKNAASSARGLEPLEQEFSMLPSIQGGYSDSSVSLTALNAEVDLPQRELGVSFLLSRAAPREGRTDYRWYVALSSPGYVMSFPSVFQLRGGDMVNFEEGESIQNVSSSRKVDARFKVPFLNESIDLAQNELTLYLYDLRGSLILSQRVDLKERSKKK